MKKERKKKRSELGEKQESHKFIANDVKRFTHSSAMSSSSSPGLNDSSAVQTHSHVSNMLCGLRVPASVSHPKAPLTALATRIVAVVSFLSDLALGLHPLQVGVVLVVVRVTVLVDAALHALRKHNTHTKKKTQIKINPLNTQFRDLGIK